MARIYKRKDVKDVLWCSFRDPYGRRIRCSTKCTSRKAAQAAADRLELDAQDPRRAAAHKTSLEACLERLLTDVENRGRASATVEFYRCKAAHLVRVLGRETRLSEIHADTVDHYIAVRLTEGASRYTLQHELTTLRQALKVARRRGEYLEDPARVLPVQWSSGYKPRRRCLRSGRDLQALVDELLPDRGAHLCFFVATGARDSEAARARRADIDLKRRTVFIRGTKTEASDDTIAIVGFMRPLLEHVLAVCGDKPGPLFRPWSNVRGDLADACDRAGIERVSPNDLRRTHGTWLRVLGVEPSLIARQLRHKDSRMAERVYGRMPADAAGAALRARLGEPASKARVKGVSRGSATGGLDGRNERKIPANLVPRDGIEPPTRGFSIRPTPRENSGKTLRAAHVA
jgi:integrase